MGLGPVVAMGFVFGGLAQMISGFQEQKMGNNFGYSAFVAYGSFWIGLGIIWILNFLKVYETSHTELGLYMLAWTLYTVIMFVASLRVHKAMAITFGLLLLGFVLLVLGLLVNPAFVKIAGYELIPCALMAWYMMAAIIINDLAGKVVLPSGVAFIR
jgi:succinate-acetate transporter protein